MKKKYKNFRHKIQEYNNSAVTLKIITDYIEITGNMGNGHHTTLKISKLLMHNTQKNDMQLFFF